MKREGTGTGIIGRLPKNTRHFRLDAALLTMAFVLAPAAARANAVDYWSDIAAQVAVAPPQSRAGLAQIDLAYVHIAIYDAVNAIDRRYSAFAVSPTTNPRGASMDAATASAAYTMLKWLFPSASAATVLDAAYVTYLLGIPDGTSKSRGIAVGAEVANAFIALRTGDGRNLPVPYTFGAPFPGVYQQTPGGPATPVGTWVGQMKTFAIDSATQFRADGPPDLTSAQWADDFNETKHYGALTNSLRTPLQTQIGQFFAENPGAQTNRNVRQVAIAHGLSVADSARFFAQAYVTMADAQITTWNSKYHYNFWRPVTAIQYLDDGNPATEPDLSWTPLVVTPGHPEYPAAHPTISGAFAFAIAQFFGTKKVAVALTSTSVPNTGGLMTLDFTNTDDIVKTAIEGRIYGGMHYRTSGVHGAVIARKVAHYVARHYFTPAM
ncbi:MAG TPA: hypothetical protein VFV95_09995 [Vicinamibacterales bacterium]|nr:hypothetical protein [Vicinamibacterales bacterium]